MILGNMGGNMARTEQRSVRGGRIAYLDGIRGVAIGAVLAVHWVAPYAHGYFGGGYAGVDLFLVLSGFVITTILWRREVAPGRVIAAYGEFLVARARRLYPALIGALTVGVALIWAFGAPLPSVASDASLAALAAVQASSLIGASGGSMGPFGHTWSLSVEWYFYLLWPLTVIWAKAQGLDPRSLSRCAAGASIIFYAASLALDPNWFYFGPISRFAQLLAGSALALWLVTSPVPLERPDLGKMLGTASLGLMGFFIAWVVLGPSLFSPAYRLVGFPLVTATGIFAILAGRFASRAAVVRTLQGRAVAFIGRISYSLYLWHVIPLGALDHHRTAAPFPVLVALVVLLTAIMTLLSYRWLEKPFVSSRRDALAAPSAENSGIPQRAGQA